MAYDFETTRIEVGTPRPLYITAYAPDMHFAAPINSLDHLRKILREEFLTEDRKGTAFVAWNGNRFDAYFVAAALVRDPDFVLRPYLTNSHALRGLRVIPAAEIDNPNAAAWEFLDGIAMLGLEGVTLEKLLLNFAPDHAKLTGVIDFESGENFDASNPLHREYAMRDSVGLWHAMNRAQTIMLQHFDSPLGVTMGGACIKIFQAHIPRDVSIRPLDQTCERIFRSYVMRGGFCYCAQRYTGPIWKYDINQAYAAAMRECELPQGQAYYWKHGIHPTARVYVARITATNPDNKIPFYYRAEIDGRIRSRFATTQILDTWLTSIEIEQLKIEGWRINALESYQWGESFTMQEFVDRLELLRTTCEGGPSGPIGTMVKATGNHSYGKTVEEIAPIEYVIAPHRPDGFQPYYGDDDSNPIEHVFYRFDEEQRQKEYHAVQLGAFITAAVRIKLRRVALLDPEAWLYADTDCVIFSRDVTDRIDIDAKRYGAWKIEETGAHYRIIAKKVYAEVTPLSEKPKKRSAKGLNVKRLTGADFEAWAQGTPPVQEQIQRQNFLMVMRGAEMFRKQTRRGTAIEAITADV